MFFKKKKAVEPEKPVVVASDGKNVYPEVVLKIHEEFMTASDKLLEQAMNIINDNPIIKSDKMQMLKSFGFDRVPEVEEIIEKEKIVKLNKEQVDLVKYYRQKYPFQKFITHEQVQAICEKYKLVFGFVDMYTGFVPEKNLKEIASAKIDEKDKALKVYARKSMFDDAFIIEFSDFEIKSSNPKKQDYFHFFRKGDDKDYAFQSNDGISFYSSDKKNLFGLRHLDDIRFIVREGLRICAPEKDMNLKGFTKNKWQLIPDKLFEDPVVLQDVKGGYLILTAWGNEASDPIVVNENLN